MKHLMAFLLTFIFLISIASAAVEKITLDFSAVVLTPSSDRIAYTTPTNPGIPVADTKFFIDSFGSNIPQGITFGELHDAVDAKVQTVRGNKANGGYQMELIASAVSVLNSKTGINIINFDVGTDNFATGTLELNLIGHADAGFFIIRINNKSGGTVYEGMAIGSGAMKVTIPFTVTLI